MFVMCEFKMSEVQFRVLSLSRIKYLDSGWLMLRLVRLGYILGVVAILLILCGSSS
jgi:hypothetical protein